MACSHGLCRGSGAVIPRSTRGRATGTLLCPVLRPLPASQWPCAAAPDRHKHMHLVGRGNVGPSGARAPSRQVRCAVMLEPANALSLPTWAIHVSSVAEWVIAMGLMWRYAEVSGNPRWKGMTWGMLPALGSAMAACTWHFFYNSPDLEFLVALQAFLTVVGNVTCMAAAFRIWQGAKAEASS